MLDNFVRARPKAGRPKGCGEFRHATASCVCDLAGLDDEED